MRNHPDPAVRSRSGRRRMGLLTVLLAATGLPSAAAGQERRSPPEIQVSATATVARAPDYAELVVGASHLANRAADAAAENAATVGAIMRALGELGFPRDSLVTASYVVRPEYQRDRDGQHLIGYRVETRIRVREHDVSRLARVIDVALDAGATEILPPSFGIADRDGARREAFRQAVEQATHDATAIAEAAGGSLGPLLHVQASGDDGPWRPEVMAMAEARAAPPIVPGDVGVTVTISARFAYLREP